MDNYNISEYIRQGEAVLGIELGSTRIKAALIGWDNIPISTGSFSWENKLENGIWTYSLDEVWFGIQACFSDLQRDVKEKYKTEITSLKAMGISAMQHGYIAIDKEGKQLAPFRTWRNTNTKESAAILSEKFQFNIPLRWSIAQLYQSILDRQEHTHNIKYVFTLASYVHWRLTGENIIGINDGSGMFPVDTAIGDYDRVMLDIFEELIQEYNYNWKLTDIFPKVKCAGENAGYLTKEGAALLDPGGKLNAGIAFCPPEGDGGTGMVATNSVARLTGNMSAGTSVFSSIVLEKPLSTYYSELDIVTTPAGDLVAMAHANTCTTDLNNWVSLFREFCELMGIDCDDSILFEKLFNKSLEADPLCGGLMTYNYFGGEPMVGLSQGVPVFLRSNKSNFNLANFMRIHLYASLSTVKVGMDILQKKEGVKIKRLMGHGGLFKTRGVAQAILSAAMHVPVTVLSNAGEGGPWGMALLASYMVNSNGEPLDMWLEKEVFAGAEGETLEPSPDMERDFEEYMESFLSYMDIERKAAEIIKN